MNPNRFLLPFLIVLGCLLATSIQAAEPSLVRRNAISLQLEGATLALKGALKKAEEMKLKVNITIVDAGGHLLTFARMDGARPASIYTSMSKASTAALKLGDTGKLGAHDGETDVHLNLAVENAASMSGGKLTTLHGGVAIVVDGQVIGGIGVGGAKGSEDAQIAKAGLEALLAGISKAAKSGDH